MSTTVPTSDALRSDIAQTRTELGGTVEDLTAKTDVKTRVQESVRQQPVRWAGAGAGFVALAAAAVGAVLWQRHQRRQENRAVRAWRAVNSRFSR